MLRPRLFETKKFVGCQDRYQLRLSNIFQDRDFYESLANHCCKLNMHDCIYFVGHNSLMFSLPHYFYTVFDQYLLLIVLDNGQLVLSLEGKNSYIFLKVGIEVGNLKTAVGLSGITLINKV